MGTYLNVVRELKESYPSLSTVEGFSATLVNAAKAAGNKFIMTRAAQQPPKHLPQPI